MTLMLQRLLQISMILLLVSGCENKSQPIPQVPTSLPTPIETNLEPKIWSDRSFDRVFQELGENIEVYRWENGFLSGWLKLDSDDENSETKEVNQQINTRLQEMVQTAMRNPSEQPVQSTELSGFVVLKYGSKEKDKTDSGIEWQDIQIMVISSLSVKRSDNSIGSTSMTDRHSVRRKHVVNDSSPRVHSSVDFSGYSLSQETGRAPTLSFEKKIWKDDKIVESSTWLELKVVDPKNLVTEKKTK